jgi:6-phosphofructokinase 1
MDQETIETNIQSLGEAKIPSPMLKEEHGGIHHLFVSDEDQVMINIKRADIQAMIANGESRPPSNWPGRGEKCISMHPNCGAPLPPAAVCARD